MSTISTGSNLLNFRAPEETEAQRQARWRPILEAQEVKRRARAEQAEAIAHEEGIDFESARLLNEYRNPHHPRYPDLREHEIEFCEALEKRLAAQKAERVVSGNGHVDWDALDRKRS